VTDVRLTRLSEGNSPFVAGTNFDLTTVGYVQAEYALSGRACAYGRTPGGIAVTEEADFSTRLLVFRPAEDSAFNGTVWVEWLNVSGGLDAAPSWVYSHTEAIRRGAAWVGVSAQQIGVMGGTSVLGMSGLALVEIDPARYGELSHPGDRFSYDIYAQASSAVRLTTDTILEGLAVERVLAIGESQSAFRLTTYVNDIDPIAPVHDGFLVHARGGNSAPLHDDGDPTHSAPSEPVKFRSDLRVPVLCVQSETDLMSLNYLAARQEDDDSFVLWEIAGAAHADVYTFVAGAIDTGSPPFDELAVAWKPVRDCAGMHFDFPVNAGPQHYLLNAAVWHLDRWVRDGTRPPSSPRLVVRDGAFVVDDYGNVLGGARTPHVDAPTAVLSGFGNGGNPVAFLAGSTTPFEHEKVRDLYGTRIGYLERFAAATDEAVAAGFVLTDDVAEINAIAEINSPL
jgi:hypothetical protein